MPIRGIEQPAYLVIDQSLRLRAYDGLFDFAYEWYQDSESLELIDGKDKAVPYTRERLKKMYTVLNDHGELYFIERKIDDTYIPVGDVTFWKDDMPIVIARGYRKQGIGKKVVQRLIQRAKEIGYGQIRVKEIFEYNTGSRRLFESCGFTRKDSTENGAGYSLDLWERGCLP